MFRLSYVVLIASALQITLSHPPPPHCRGPPPDVEKPHECCKIPPMFADEDLEACGIPKLDEQSEERRFRGPPDCSKQKCIMTKYKMLKDDNIDYDAVRTFIDDWAEKNPSFKPTVETAKDRCLRELPGPPEVCEADKMVHCMGTTMFFECPVWEDTDNCKKLKDHMESCKPKP